MRVKLLIVTILVAASASSAFAQQSYPASMAIAGDVEVRSGPGEKFYPTMKLKAGDRVVVLRELKDNPGWLAIAPPSGSFSWIDGKYVRRVDNQFGYVDADVNRKVPILPGSSLVNQEPNNISHNLTAGCIVTIVHQPLTLGNTVWIPIKPHVQEERYVPVTAVRPSSQVVSNQNWTLNTGSPTGNAAVLASVDQAVRAGNLESARQILNKAAADTNDPATRTYYTNYLARLNQGPSNVPGQPNATPTNGFGRSPATTTAFSVPQAQPAASQGRVGDRQWSSYGTLQPSEIRIDGQQVYVLKYSTGHYLYVTTPPGKSLSSFVGRSVALYGAIQYSGEQRKLYMQATDIAVP